VILMELGKIATKDREYNIAIRRLNQALEKVKERQRPQSMQAAVHAALATAYLKKGDTGRAITNSQDAIDLDENAAGPQLVMGLTYMRLERPQRAVPFLAKAVQLDPSRLEAYEQLGKAYAKAGDKANALKWFQAYLGRNPPAAAAGRVTREMQRLQQ
jgi:tetratricopeptide (TPR) repeat protein